MQPAIGVDAVTILTGPHGDSYAKSADATIIECINDFNYITYEPFHRLCYVGTDNYLEGESCARILAGLLTNQGQVAILLNSFDKVNHRLRQKGFTSYLAENCPAITVVSVMETRQIPENTYQRTMQVLDEWPNISGLYVDEASTPHMALKALQERGRLGRIKVVAYDVTKLSWPYIRDGYLSTLSQNPFRQGYNPVLYVYNFLVSQQRPACERLFPTSAEMELIDQDSLHQFWDDSRGRIVSPRIRQTLPRPSANPTQRPLKIVVFLPDDQGFFEIVQSGILDAASLLIDLAVDVSIVIPEPNQRDDTSARTVQGYIEHAIRQGAQAIITPVYDKALIPYLNSLHELGVVVATFNSEPIGLRTLLDLVFHNNQVIPDEELNKLTRLLQARESTIDKINQELEARVQSRTNELSQSNTALQASMAALEQAQSQLLKSEKLAALGTLVAGVAHELNTPVGVGVTSASYLREKTLELTCAMASGAMKKTQLDKFMQVVNESSEIILFNLERAAGLIRDFKQISIDQTVDTQRAFNLKDYLESIVNSLVHDFKKTRFNLEINCPSQLTVNSYPGAIAQIFTNLLLNSLKHGFLNRQTGLIRIQVQPAENQQLRIEYCDDGNGLSAESLAHHFEPFYTTMRQSGGSGLGTFIVYNLVNQRLGGRISVTSQIGQGIQYTIWLPLEINSPH